MKENTTQEKILHNAKKLFAEHGFSGTTTEMIASSVKINKASLYYFFKNKEDIYANILEGVIKETISLFENVEDKNNTFLKRLEKLFQISKENGPFIFSAKSMSKDCLKKIGCLSENLENSMKKYLKTQKILCGVDESLELITDTSQNYALKSAQKRPTMSPEKYAKLLFKLINKK